nr:hypothetical protein [Tanacetum cinerariifolium]
MTGDFHLPTSLRVICGSKTERPHEIDALNVENLANLDGILRHFIPLQKFSLTLTGVIRFNQVMGITIDCGPIKTKVKHLFGDVVRAVMSLGGSIVASLKNINSFLAMSTPPDDLIRTDFKQERVVPKVMLHIFKEFFLLLGRHPFDNKVPHEYGIDGFRIGFGALTGALNGSTARATKGSEFGIWVSTWMTEGWTSLVILLLVGGTVSFVTSVSRSTTLGGEEVVGIVGPLYAIPLRVVIHFKSSFGLVTVLLGSVPEPEDKANGIIYFHVVCELSGSHNLRLRNWGLDEPELGNPGLDKPVLDKLEADFDHD